MVLLFFVWNDTSRVSFFVDVLTDKHITHCTAFSIDLNVLMDKCGLRKFPVRTLPKCLGCRIWFLLHGCTVLCISATFAHITHEFGTFFNRNADSADFADERGFLKVQSPEGTAYHSNGFQPVENSCNFGLRKNIL